MRGLSELSRSWRLDYTTSDQPVALTAAVEALEELGVTVGACDVRPTLSGDVVVVGTVALPPWLDVPAVEYALRRAGATDVRAVRSAVRRPTTPVAGVTGLPVVTQRDGRFATQRVGR